jgi:hypothetical protein
VINFSDVLHFFLICCSCSKRRGRREEEGLTKPDLIKPGNKEGRGDKTG